MELDKFLIGILVFTAVVVGGTLIIGNFNTNYDDVMQDSINTTDFGDVYDSTDEIYNLSQDMKDSMLGGEVDEDDTSDSMFKGGYKTIRFIQSSFGLVGDIVNAIAVRIGIPSFFITLALAALTISIIFGLIYIIFRIAKG
jgi:hypothetical protein